ncbi:hypothetical protein [Peterkaempfera bronchialis]|uniref:hypothetical protein n=1 Tax=Peterkaempfera bronchialis TaxID=2126346 RepID=UPI003C2C7469
MNQRRPNSRELNPEDLFRPEPDPSPYQQSGGGYGYPGPGGGPQDGSWGAPAQPGGPDGSAAHYPPPYPEAAPAPGGQDAAATQYLPPYPTTPAPGGPDQAAATQYLPPYPPGDPAAMQQQPPGFGAAPAQPPAPVPPYGGRQLRDEPEQRSSRRSSRPSAKAIAGVVVGACALVGILGGALFSGGGDGDKTPAAASTPATGATGSQQPESGAPAAPPAASDRVDPEMKAQAQALAGLMGTASNSRGSVVAAVGAIRGCQDLGNARQKLVEAAGQRRQLVTNLEGLKVDKLPDGARLADRLRAAWQASAKADEEYAAWAGDSGKSCRRHHRPANGGHLSGGDAASGVATAAKKQASDLWNPIARRTGLPTRSYSDL